MSRCTVASLRHPPQPCTFDKGHKGAHSFTLGRSPRERRECVALDNYRVDPERHGEGYSTGIYIRAQLAGKWGNHDLAVLDRDSVLRWLTRSDELPTNTVLAILGHESQR